MSWELRGGRCYINGYPLTTVGSKEKEMRYSITGKGNGNSYGVYEGANETEALQALFDDAGDSGTPDPVYWIVQRLMTTEEILAAKTRDFNPRMAK